MSAAIPVNLDNLLPELLLSIADHLTYHDIASLTLTCKRLYTTIPLLKSRSHAAILSSSYIDTDITPPDHIIHRLEKSLSPSYVLCESCSNFHLARKTPKIHQNWKKWVPCAANQGSWPHFHNYNFHIQYADVQAIMHRHRWGDAHSAPLESIAINIDSKIVSKKDHSTGSFLTRLEINPYIIEDMLILHTKQYLLFRLDSYTNE